jgi:hypothetical protein
MECIGELKLNAKYGMAMKRLENNPQICTAAIFISEKEDNWQLMKTDNGHHSFNKIAITYQFIRTSVLIFIVQSFNM